jgi:hypothetical protein
VKTANTTAAQGVLLAAFDLSRSGKKLFSEWDLTVAAWKRDHNRFGLRGYEQEHPDHKRVMMEIMSQKKKDNPVRRGWIEKAGTNQYGITSLGLAEAERLAGRAVGTTGAQRRSPQPIYDAIDPYVFHPVFLAHCRQPEEPRTWLGASAFLSLRENTPKELEDRLQQVRNAVVQALGWLKEEGQEILPRGPVGGGRTIRRTDVEKLGEFIELLEDRFSVQVAAIRKKRSG